MDIAVRAVEAGRDLERRDVATGLEIRRRARRETRVPGLLDQHRQPADLELHAGAGDQVGIAHARDEARPDSDVDVFIDKEPSRHFGFHEFMGIYLALREVLGVEVGYTTREGLVEFYRPDIEREAIRVF